MARRGWSRPLSGFADEVEREQNRRLRATALQALSGVIERSPVDTGAFRSNNRVSVGRSDVGYDLDASSSAPRGSTNGVNAFDDGLRIIGQVRNAFDVIYVQNNLPYAERLEAGDSRQAPAGVFAITFNDLKEGGL